MYLDFPDRKLNRMRGYDYSQNGYYFVTICVKSKIEYFGSIKNGQMNLNKFGKIVEYCWHDLINHYRNCRLDEFIIMPNHVHGIVEIDNNFARINNMPEGAGLKPARTHFDCANYESVRTAFPACTHFDRANYKSVCTALPARTHFDRANYESVRTAFPARTHFDRANYESVRTAFPARTHFDRTKLSEYSLSEIIRGFKSFSSRKINKGDSDFVFRWQRSFYDHIIRNHDSVNRIRKYIRDNPTRWELDRNNEN